MRAFGKSCIDITRRLRFFAREFNRCIGSTSGRKSRGIRREGSPGAFCGLANPATFWDTLRGLGVSPAFQWTFDDHHSYQWTELQRLAGQARLRGSNVLLTTEKDAMNLPERAAEVLNEASVDLYWLKIGIRLDEEAEFLKLIESAC